MADKSIKLIKNMLYMEDSFAPIRGNDNLLKDIEFPYFMSQFLRLNKVSITLWEKFKRKPKFNHKERLVCLMKGSEKVRMVSAIFK